jgi:uncharacterized membrane protein
MQTRHFRSCTFVQSLSAGVLAAAVMYSSAGAQSYDQGRSYWPMHGGWSHMMEWGGMMAGGIGMLLFWALAIVVIVLLARGYRRGRLGTSSLRSPRSGPGRY